MNKYIVKIGKYFGGYDKFREEAESKKEAKNNAIKKAEKLGGGNYRLEDIKIKKVTKF